MPAVPSPKGKIANLRLNDTCISDSGARPIHIQYSTMALIISALNEFVDPHSARSKKPPTSADSEGSTRDWGRATKLVLDGGGSQ
jgi:hypothetical protein